MRAAWLCALCAACAVCAASDSSLWPACGRSAACERGPEREEGDEWTARDYIVNGKRWSVAQSGDAEQWRCAAGDPADAAVPRHRSSYMARAVEFIDCAISPATAYAALLKKLLSLNSLQNLTLELTVNRHPDCRPVGRWPSADELKQIKLKIINDPEFASGDADGVEHLILRGTMMSGRQLASVRRVQTLSLTRTGLEEVMDLSLFTELRRLEITEPGLRDGRRIASAPALRELVLWAPDAGLAAMPRLRRATFLEVYATGSIFGNCANLEELALVGGELDAVRGRWLAGCMKLQLLRLTRLPRLRELPAGLLADAVALETLDLSGDGLEVLPADLLSHSPRLTRLDLSSNHLLMLPEGFLKTVGSDTRVYACGLDVTIEENNLPNVEMENCESDSL